MVFDLTLAITIRPCERLSVIPDPLFTVITTVTAPLCVVRRYCYERYYNYRCHCVILYWTCHCWHCLTVGARCWLTHARRYDDIVIVDDIAAVELCPGHLLFVVCCRCRRVLLTLPFLIDYGLEPELPTYDVVDARDLPLPHCCDLLPFPVVFDPFYRYPAFGDVALNEWTRLLPFRLRTPYLCLITLLLPFLLNAVTFPGYYGVTWTPRWYVGEPHSLMLVSVTVVRYTIDAGITTVNAVRPFPVTRLPRTRWRCVASRVCVVPTLPLVPYAVGVWTNLTNDLPVRWLPTLLFLLTWLRCCPLPVDRDVPLPLRSVRRYYRVVTRCYDCPVTLNTGPAVPSPPHLLLLNSRYQVTVVDPVPARFDIVDLFYLVFFCCN